MDFPTSPLTYVNAKADLIYRSTLYIIHQQDNKDTFRLIIST